MSWQARGSKSHIAATLKTSGQLIQDGVTT
jgi:hypothetical protein